MLVVMHDGDVEALLQTFFNVKALRRLDVFQVNTAKGRCYSFYGLAEFLRILFCYFDIKDVDTSIYFKQQAFTFHDRLSTHGTYISKSQYSRSVGNDSNQISFVGVSISIVRILLYFETWIGYTWRVCQ